VSQRSRQETTPLCKR